jgi:pyruvate/2-oxoglutarate dehydrogenase complex dihydrolipoamide acyltransferase (E2) component
LPTDFILPELGEQIEAGDVLRVLVKPGDTLIKEQPVLELETDKATIEVPSSVAGRITDVKVKVGDKVSVGQAILTVDDAEGASADGAEGQAQEAPAQTESTRSQSAGANKPATATIEKPPASAKPAKPGAQGKAQAAAPQGQAGSVGANTAAKVSEDEGLEQHVEGRKGAARPDKSGVSAETAQQGSLKRARTRWWTSAAARVRRRRRRSCLSRRRHRRCVGWRVSSEWTSTRCRARAREAAFPLRT